MYHKVTDRAHKSTFEGPEASGAHHDHAGFLGVRRVDNELARILVEVGDQDNIADNLQQELECLVMLANFKSFVYLFLSVINNKL